MTWIIEIAYHSDENGESTELYGAFTKQGKAEWDAKWLQEQFDKLPRDPNRWVTVTARSLSKLNLGGQAFQALLAEAEKFLEPSDQEYDDSAYGQYSIDHSGSGS